MRKFRIGFNTNIGKQNEQRKEEAIYKPVSEPRKSVVFVYFSHRGTGWAYYNDSFDLKVGDYVYVEGKLEGYKGQVRHVDYSFKINPANYKRVTQVVDTNIKGDFYLTPAHFLSFDKNTVPFSKVITWFKAPKNEDDYVSGDDYSNSFSIDDLSNMKADCTVGEQGYDYYMENKVVFVETDGTCGRAVVEGSESYEIEFNYVKGEISNLKCSCFCCGVCKHEFAAMLQLREILKLIDEKYENEYNDYFAAIDKDVLANMVMNKKTSGKISLGV